MLSGSAGRNYHDSAEPHCDKFSQPHQITLISRKSDILFYTFFIDALQLMLRSRSSDHLVKSV